jgi:glycine cleavage system H protein
LPTTVPAYRYSASHQWAHVESDGLVAVGITDFAQEALGDVMFIEFPALGRVVAKDEACAVVESVKSASDVMAPVAGVVTEVNTALTDTPEQLNQSPYEAWLFKLKIADPNALNELLDARRYRALTDEQSR